jgi:NAD-dependent deacetylase
MMSNDLQRIAELLRAGRRVLFITGAGVSAESGITTFRGAKGAFADGRTEEGVPFVWKSIRSRRLSPS